MPREPPLNVIVGMLRASCKISTPSPWRNLSGHTAQAVLTEPRVEPPQGQWAAITIDMTLERRKYEEQRLVNARTMPYLIAYSLTP